MDDAFFSFEPEDLVADRLRVTFVAPYTRQAIDQVIDEQQLLEAEGTALYQTVKDVFRGRVEVDEIAANLFDRVGLDFDLALAVQADIYDRILGDIEDELDEQRQLYLDINPEATLPPEPKAEDLDQTLAEEAVDGSGLAPADRRLKERLVDIAASRLKEVRDDQETEAMLRKPEKTGGLNFDEQQAKAVTAILKAVAGSRETRKQQLEKEREEWLKAKQKADEVRQKRLAQMSQPSSEPPSPEPPPTKSEDLMLASETEDETEIETIKEQMEEMPAEESTPAPAPLAATVEPTVAPSADQAGFLAGQVDQAIADSGFKPKNEDIQRRFRALVELYFRDLRDELETREKLALSIDQGGLGLKPDKADQIMESLKGKVQVYQSVMNEQVAKQKKEFVAERQEQATTVLERQEQRDATARDQLFERITGQAVDSVPAGSVVGQAAKPSAGEIHALPTHQPIKVPEPKKIPVVAVPRDRKPAASAPPTPASATAEPMAAAVAPPKPAPTAMPERPATAPPKPMPAAPPVSQPQVGKTSASQKAAPPLNLPSLDEAAKRPAMLPDEDHCQGPAEKAGTASAPPPAPPIIKKELPTAPESVKPAPVKPATPAMPPKAAPAPSAAPLEVDMDIFNDGHGAKPAEGKGGLGAPTQEPWEMQALRKAQAGQAAPSTPPESPKPITPPKPEPAKSVAPAPPPAPPLKSAAPVPPKPPAPPKPPMAQLGLAKPPAPPPKPEPAKSVAPAPPPVPSIPPKPAVMSAAEPPSDERKVVSDVKFTPKLVGPVEELKNLKLADFRRLSKEPKEATLKINDKIDLLQEQSFETKTAGVKAWQESEVNKMYLELLKQSLEGRPVVEIIKEKQDKKEPVLTKPEFDAIMALNRKLRFG